MSGFRALTGDPIATPQELLRLRTRSQGLDRAIELVEARGGSAQLCVIHRGKTIIDRSFNCSPESLFWIFSASKPFAAVLIHRLVDQGLLALDDPISRYWPRFARNGKSAVTIRNVLQHRSGLPTARGGLQDALAMTDWERSVRLLEMAKPQYRPGTVPAYQYVSFGFILGEVARRVTGVAFSQLLTTEILQPLGLGSTYAGVPVAQEQRSVDVRIDGLVGAAVSAFLNRRATREAVIPAAGVSTTARDLAAFYAALLASCTAGGGDGNAILSPTAFAAAVTPSADRDIDHYLRLRIRWSHGFQLGGFRSDAPNPLGQTSSEQAFGHNGSNCCIAWADPQRQLVVAYLGNRITARGPDMAHHAAVADAILAGTSG